MGGPERRSPSPDEAWAALDAYERALVTLATAHGRALRTVAAFQRGRTAEAAAQLMGWMEECEPHVLLDALAAFRKAIRQERRGP